MLCRMKIVFTLESTQDMPLLIIWKTNLSRKFNNQTFTQKSANLKINFYIPKNLFVQHLPVKDREQEIENNRMRNGYSIEHLRFVDILEIVKFGGKVIEIDEGVIYRKNFKVSPFRNVLENLFALRQKYKKNNDVMQLLVKLLMNSLYGEQTRKNIEEGFACKSEVWMISDYDERVEIYWKISHGNCFVKKIDDDELEDEVKKLNTMPLHLGAFVLSNSKRILKSFIHANNGFFIHMMFITQTLIEYT